MNIKMNPVTCLITEKKLPDTNIPRKLDLTFNRDGRKWRVTAFTDTFVIGTAVDAKTDNHGEPVRASDIIKVML